MDRRAFLVMSSVVGGSLLTGCTVGGRFGSSSNTNPSSNSGVNTRTDELASATRTQPMALNGWVKVGPDNTVSVLMGRSEMGQGVHTALLMLVAEELDCAWNQIQWEQAPIDPLYGNIAAIAEGVPFRPDDRSVTANTARWVMRNGAELLGFMMTGGSASVRDMWLPMRQAAAATRSALFNAVSKHWKLDASLIKLNAGVFTGPGNLKATFSDAVLWAGSFPEPDAKPRLKDPKQFRVLGKPMPRVEALSKVEGSAQFGLDVRPPGVVYAAVKLSPILGSKSVQANLDAVKSLPGVLGVITLNASRSPHAGVAVVADSWWKAKSAADTIEIQADPGALTGFSSTAAMAQLKSAAHTQSGFAYWKKGEAEQVLKQAQPGCLLTAEYQVPYLAHATMEPMNCTVQYLGTHAVVWCGTQTPDFAQRAAAKALGLSKDKVEVKVTYLGGGFGRRLESDIVTQAAEIARQFPNKPVQLIWTRENDLQHDFYRPACYSRFSAALDEKGQLAAWVNASASQAIVAGFMSRNAGLPGFGPDKTSAEGAFDIAYEFPNARVSHVAVDLPVPVGFWRSVGHSHHAFFTESFLDECAHAAGQDPYAYRRALLKQHPRELGVLDLAAEKAGWAQALSPSPEGHRRGRGIALHSCFGSIVAQVAELTLTPAGIRVDRVVCAMDCGFAVNPNGVVQQIESSIIFGLSAAFYGQIDFENGQVKQSNFHDYPILRLNQTPVIEAHIVPSTEPPGGVGEPAVPPLAPAVANAVFAASGQRLRALPLKLTA